MARSAVAVNAQAAAAVVVPAARRRWLLNEHEPTWDFAPAQQWPAEWTGMPAVALDQQSTALSAPLAWSPCLLVAALLVLTRLPQIL